MDFIFIEGAFAFIIFVMALLIHEPKRIPFVLKSLALFIVVRSIFMTLTHLGPAPGALVINSSEFVSTFSLGADMFFSGHTGLPFLFALMFWNRYYLRTFFLISSAVAGVSVLLGHLHYSIDVFAAFFITYGIFHAAQKFFAKEYHVFVHGLLQEKK